MSELALKLISESKHTQKTFLDLGYCNLKDGDFQVDSKLYNTLLECQHIESINFSDRWFEWNKELHQWEYHVSTVPTDFRRYATITALLPNHLYSIPFVLCKLSKLKKIIFSYFYKEWDKEISIDTLLELHNLEELYLSQNLLTDIEPLKNLNSLKVLDLGGNSITNIEVLSNLKSLKILSLLNNKITSLNSLKKLTDLECVDLRNNEITDIKPLKKVITKGVQVISLGDIYTINDGINIFGNSIVNPPLEIINHGNEAILNYFEQIEVQGTEPIYEARLLIVGEPGAGKTSLMKKLIDPFYKVYENKIEIESTVGINIHEGWSFPYKRNKTINFLANLWDFGGQEIQYLTHQFFLSGRVLYVLVADNRMQNTNFPYWFEIIHLLGKDHQNKQSPILVVLNENQHKSITNYDHAGYLNIYPKSKIEYLNVDLSKSDDRFKTLYQKIQDMLCQLSHIGEPLPKFWQPIRDDLRKLSKRTNHITDEEFKEICFERGIESHVSIKTLSTYLHDLGVILNFHEDRNLSDFIVLNPEWAVDAVYCILKDDRIDKNAGRFDESFLSEIWDGKYTKTEQKNLLGLMLKDNFEICYEYTKGKFIAPQFLKDVKTDFGFDNSDSLKFQFHYDFMPKGIITRLIVRLSNFIAEKDKTPLVSKKNVIFEKETCMVWVNESDFENKGEIRIQVNGIVPLRREVMWWIRDEIKQIHKRWYNSLEPKEYIPCNCKSCKKSKIPHFFDFEYLLKCVEKNKQNVNCQKSLDDINVISLIDGIYKKKEQDLKFHLKKVEKKINFLQETINNISNIEAELLNVLINKKLEEFESELPKQIITEWKKATNSSNYKIDNKDKLKLTLPIIPKILSYEKEISIDSLKVFSDIYNNITEVWRGEKTIQEIFINQ